MKDHARLCTFCNATATSKDHIVPVCFYPKPRPSDLVTVPSCKSCNNRFSLHDQYVRDILVLREGNNENAATLRKTLLEKWDTDPSRLRLAKRIRKASHWIRVLTPAGLHVGRRLAFMPEYDRVEFFMVRVIKGLYYHEHKAKLPAHLAIRINPTIEFDPEMAGLAAPAFHGITPKIIGKGLCEPVFEYAFRQAEDDDEAAVWILRFYGKTIFLGLVANPSSMAIDTGENSR